MNQPQNYGTTLAIEAAVESGIRPSSLVLSSAQPNDEWTVEDKRLVVALHLLNKQTCQKCGKPIWICRSSNNRLTFSVRKGICYASAALEKEQKKLEDSKNKSVKLKPGEFLYTVPQMIGDDEPLPTRAEWLESEADE